MTEASPQHGALPAQIVVRPDPARYRVRAFANGALTAALIALIVFATVADGADHATRSGVLIGASLGLLVVLTAWRWQVTTWLDSEPALILQAGQFRLRHKDEFVWVPWTDVAALRVSAPAVGIGRVPALIFELRHGAVTVLPARTAPIVDRIFALHNDALAYARPCDDWPFDDVVQAAEAYFENSRA